MVRDHEPVPCKVVIKEGGRVAEELPRPSRRQAKRDAAVERDLAEIMGTRKVEVTVVPLKGRRRRTGGSG